MLLIISAAIFLVCRVVLEGPLHHGHDEGERGRVDEVHELGVEQGLEARAGLLRGIRQGLQQDGHDGLRSNLIEIRKR